MIAMSDLHWAAGFLEGEGCFMALHNRTETLHPIGCLSLMHLK